MNKSALISWIGDVDLIYFIKTLPQNKMSLMIENLSEGQNKENFKDRFKSTPHKISPIITILKCLETPPESLFLLTNRAYDVLKLEYGNFIRKNIPNFKGQIHIKNLSDISHIGMLPEIYHETQEVIKNEIRPHHSKLFCNLTSGAGVTSSALVMLAAAYFADYEICQVNDDRISRRDKLPEDFSELILKRGIHTPPEVKELIGESPEMKKANEKASRMAQFDYNILILGPSGTGKSTLAEKIHKLSSRKSKRFIHVNCGGLTSTLLESRLFGHKKGAFTDAKEDRSGEFENADGGTLFLDEIADCPPELQQMLLNALQPPPGKKTTIRKFKVMGGEEKTSDVRIIAGTNKDLWTLVEEGKFREDLYFRLAVTPITMPSLKERPEDIIIIADDYLKTINDENKNVPGYTPKKLSADAKEKLRRHSWPGNVRELQNVLQESAIFTDGDTISADNIDFLEKNRPCSPGNNASLQQDISLTDLMRDIEHRLIQTAIENSGGNKAEASRRLGMKSPQNLESRIRALERKISAPSSPPKTT